MLNTKKIPSAASSVPMLALLLITIASCATTQSQQVTPQGPPTAPEISLDSVAVYPPAAVAVGLEGGVDLKIMVSKYGKPLNVAVVRSNHPIFVQAATDAAMKVGYKLPLTPDGKPRDSVVIEQSVNFRLPVEQVAALGLSMGAILQMSQAVGDTVFSMGPARNAPGYQLYEVRRTQSFEESERDLPANTLERRSYFFSDNTLRRATLTHFGPVFSGSTYARVIALDSNYAHRPAGEPYHYSGVLNGVKVTLELREHPSVQRLTLEK